MEASTIAKLIDAIPYAWGVAGLLMAIFAMVLISILNQKPETYNHNRYERDNLFS